MSTIEAFAHEMRGGITLFFLFWCFKLYPYIRRSRMMRLLFVNTVWITFCYLKDMVFLVEEWKYSIWLDNLVHLIDMIYMPLVCAFFLETTRPGFATRPRIIAAVMIQALFIPIYLIWPTKGVIQASYIVGFTIGMLATISVIIFAARYQRYLSTHYSYSERLNVHWVVISCLAYFCSYVAYTIAFDPTTWLSETLYNLFSLILWTFLFLYARRHRTLKRRVMIQNSANKQEEKIEPIRIEEEIEEEEQNGAGVDASHEAYIAARLTQCMEQERLYLNPLLSLRDVSIAIGSNISYLSRYLNHNLCITFYDYINRYRVEEACRLIDEMHSGKRSSMAEVAQQSGFNSISSFNRYFKKTKGITPKEYYQNRPSES
ncbi:MAG: helix-turn-helix domain-containing protein [Parabacteroides sp.]